VYLLLCCKPFTVHRFECLGTLAASAMAQLYRSEGYVVTVLPPAKPASRP